MNTSPPETQSPKVQSPVNLPSPNRTPLIVLIVAIILFMSIGLTIYQLKQQSRRVELPLPVSPTPIPVQEVDKNEGTTEEPSNWETYRKNNYSFKYPSTLNLVTPVVEGMDLAEWVILTNLNVRKDGVPENSSILSRYETGEGEIGGGGSIAIYDGFWLRIETDANDEPEDVIENIRTANRNSTRLLIDGQEAYRSRSEKTAGGYSGTQEWATIINNNNIFYIRTDYRSDEQDYKNIFNQILSTFKFIISDQEKLLIDSWLQQNNLNQYGDPKDRVYAGGTPLFDERTGERVDRYEYILKKFPERPWNNQ